MIRPSQTETDTGRPSSGHRTISVKKRDLITIL